MVHRHVLALVIVIGTGVACGASTTTQPCPAAPAVAAAPASAPSSPDSPIAPADDELAKLANLVGEWRGEGHGEPGDASVERSYRWVLGGKYLEVRNRSTYAPQPTNPKGEIHEDLGYVSHDRGRKKLVFRQFHVEGFVNQYVVDSATADTWVFASEAIENIPAGFTARETLRFVGPDQLEETFEIAPPGKELAVYSKTTLKRVTPGS